jgi:tRNA G18 (ribose-2'-O)-methylase SpoU
MEDVLAGAACVVVVEGVNDHENLGSIFRNSAALGADAVLLCPHTCDPLYRRSVRVSLGQVLRVPFTTLAQWPDGLRLLRERGFELIALTPAPDAMAIDSVDLSQDSRVALLLGAEGEGLSRGALEQADHPVRIPMSRQVDSINVATACAIALHHLRERSPTSKRAGHEAEPGGDAYDRLHRRDIARVDREVR